jgi:opacity protein-like surface antigen
MKKILAALAISLLATTAAQAADMAAVDTDGNGTVSMEEAKAAMPDMADDAFTAADANGDGQLDADEFAKLAQ